GARGRGLGDSRRRRRAPARPRPDADRLLQRPDPRRRVALPRAEGDVRSDASGIYGAGRSGLRRGLMDRLSRAIADLADRAVDIAAELVAIPSDGPGHDERAVVAALGRAATALGLPPGEIVAGDPAHPNVLFSVRGEAP